MLLSHFLTSVLDLLLLWQKWLKGGHLLLMVLVYRQFYWPALRNLAIAYVITCLEHPLPLPGGPGVCWDKKDFQPPQVSHLFSGLAPISPFLLSLCPLGSFIVPCLDVCLHNHVSASIPLPINLIFFAPDLYML